LSKRYYESYLIIDGNLEDSAIEDEIKKFETLLLKNDVEIKNVDKMGRKRLAYPIKKRQNGFYVCFEVMASPELIVKIERAYVLDENILRYLTIFMSDRALKEKDEHLKNRAIIQSKFEETKSIQAAEEAKALELAAAAVDAKSETKSETKPETKPETKSEAKSEAKSETKSEAKPEAKPETKPETKSEAKPEDVKPEVKEESKTESNL